MQPGINKPVVSDDLSEQMLALYRATGIFASEEPVRNTVKRLIKLSPSMDILCMVPASIVLPFQCMRRQYSRMTSPISELC